MPSFTRTTNDPTLLPATFRHIEADLREWGSITVSWTSEKPRTDQQNAALHVWLDLLAYQLNEAGLDQKKVIEAMKQGVEIPWSRNTAKENLWRPIQEHVTGKKSSTKITTKEIDEILDILAKFFGRMGFQIPEFPKREAA